MSIFAEDQHFILGQSHFPKGGQFGPLHETYLNLIAVYQGEVEVTVDDKVYVIDEGQASVVYNEHLIQLKFPRSREVSLAWCETGEILASKETVLKIKSSPDFVPISNRLKTLLDLGIGLELGDGYNYDQLRDHLGMVVFYEYFYQANLLEQELPLPKSIVRAKRFIEEHYAQEISLDMIAEQASLSKQYLTNLFKQHVGFSPSEYLWKIRTEHGGKLLNQSNLNVSEIAYKCGFRNPFHFSRKVKNLYGYSPKELRRRKWHREPSTVKEEVPTE